MALCDLAIHVMDENDNPPIFESNPYVASVAENVEKGSSILRVAAQDADVGTGADVRYYFGAEVGNAANVFHLDSKTGWITTLTALDYETISSYNFSVVAKDRGHPSLSSVASVVIKILDYNDNPPEFARKRYDTVIYEDAAPGTDIVALEIRDADFESTKVEFYIIEGNTFEQFQVRQTGEVCVKKPLDRERVAHYLLEVIATDGLFLSTTKVAIDVLDANDNPPICLKPRYSEWISEAVPPNTYVVTVDATDADDGVNSMKLFSLHGAGAEDFLIDSVTGVLKTARNLDRETQSRYSLIARVQDRGRPEWECTSRLEIILDDVNDNPPRFTQPLFSVAVPEDAPIGTLLTKVHAVDTDLGINRKISYTLTESASGHFSIDPQTGIIRLLKPLDRETLPAFNLSVQAADHGDPPLASVIPVRVTVLDCNDNPPEFETKMMSATLSETATLGEEVVRVIATSRDIGINAKISYSIAAGDDRQAFHISPDTGIITVAKHLDYETLREYFLTVLAVDAGNPPLSSQAVVNITLTDANDNSPVFSQTSYRALIPEDATVGTNVIQVVASDADSGQNAELHFSIISGDSLDQFTVDSSTGAVKVASPLDRELVPSYILHIQCSDKGSPRLTSTALLNIEVSDVNDNAPLFSQINYTGVVQEGKPLGYTVLKFSILDADAPPNTGPFSLSIVSGNVDGAFRLVQQDATLRTNTRFDHRKRDQYKLQLRVSDNGSPPLTSEVWATILVIEESQFPPVIYPLEVTINSYMDDFPGGAMGKIHATDEDPYDELHFGLVSPLHNQFSVARDDGTLIALPGLDVGKYIMNVSVTDGKFTTYGNISIEVNMVTEEALKNGVGLRLKNLTPEDFLLSYRRNFVLGLRNALTVRTKDVELLSVQPAAQDITNRRRRRSGSTQDLDVLFAVRKTSHVFHPAKQVAAKLKEKQSIFENSSGLKILKIMKDRCSLDRCAHGDCVDRVIFDKTYMVSITTESMSYLSPQHVRKIECLCEAGFGGSRCETATNECARKPCSAHFICFPDPSELGYVCQCPPGKTGPLCDRDKVKSCQRRTCYEEKSPISFGGRSYSRYSLVNPLDRQLSLSLNIRTVQLTGNLMYVAGIRDYSILEIVGGYVQYRFDCGSGEGLVRAEGYKVNDGEWHEVALDRRGNAADLVVDGEYRSSGHAPGPHDILNLEGQDVYFGAEVRHHPFSTSMLSASSASYEDIRMGFVGCMDDIRLDGIPLPLHTAASGISTVMLRRFANVEFQCSVLFDPGACGSQPCANGGSCRVVDSAFSCQCLPRFLGPRCEIDTNPCASSPCLNGASCHNVNNTYRCDCPEGLSGYRCDYGRFCNPNPCHNGGACEEGSYIALCKCRGYYGDLCQYDMDECQAHPCGPGATCTNVPGSFLCHCPPNVTGSLCTEHLHTNSITSTRWNTTIEEIVGISVLVVFIMLMAGALACCWRIRHKRRQRRPGLQLVDDPAANEFMLKNPILDDKETVKRLSSKGSLEATFATPPLPPRPASYTPSTQESLSALAKFDTVRSYGSAADDLNIRDPSSLMYVQNNLGSKAPPVSLPPSLTTPPPSNSDSDSLLKDGWEADINSSKEKIYEEKIQNSMTPRVVSSSLGKNKCQQNSTVPSLSSMDELAGYHWDVSDWATSPNSEGNVFDISSREGQDDSSSLQSTDSNSFVSQIELQPNKVINEDRSSKESSPADKHPNSTKEVEANDVGSPECPDVTYLPPPCFANTAIPPHSWPDEDEVKTDKIYCFPFQGGRGFRVDLECGHYGDVQKNSGSFDSNSINSTKVCELDDSEANISDTEIRPPKEFKSTMKPSYV